MTTAPVYPPSLSQTPLSTSAESDFQRLEQFVQEVSTAYRQGNLPDRKLARLQREFGDKFLHNTLHGHVFRKPFGYAGDYLIIDKIYTRHTSNTPGLRLWDEYFQQLPAARAVRNRKTYFKMLVRRAMKANPAVTLLNVGSGPARDLAELYDSLHRPRRLHTTCVDVDARAIAYAQELNRPYLPWIRFEQKNALRFFCEQNFHLIWSAGLFDYLNDKTFVRMLRRFKYQVKPRGEIVIGNFNEDNNPSRNYMEVFGQWYLHHRTESQLVALAQQAGFADRQITVGREPENVNLFLHIKMD